MKTLVRLRARFAHPYLALPAAAALWLAAGLPAQAQFFSSSGATSSFPAGYESTQVLDLTGTTVSIGNSAPGSFAAMGGGILKAGSLSVGDGVTGSGTVEFTGTGTSALLGGTVNRLQVGNWGTGSLSVLAGAVIDATVNAGACTGAWCYGFIGNAAGSNATLTVSGAGSEVRTLRNLVVGQTAVFTTASDGFNFGTPGATTNAFVNVLAGGSMRSENAVIGQGPTNAAALGTERGFGTVVIDGAGSRWLATRNTIDNFTAFVGVGNGVGGHGAVTVRNGGQMIVDGTGGSTSSFDALNIGQNGGTGNLTVTGIGSSVQVAGNNPIIQVGRGGATGQGVFSVLDGATATAMFANLGRDGASGTMVIDGAGSLLSLTGVGTTGTAGPAGATIGQNGGSGQATVSNGGRWLISDGGSDSRPAGSSPFLNIGRDAASSGTLTIMGAGSTVELVSTSLGLASGTPDNFNPYMAVGRFSGSNGNLVIGSGGKLLLQGNALSTVADSRGTTLAIGGSNDATAGGNGTALVSGPGSEIRLSGSDTFIAVGRGPGAIGQLTVADQAAVSATNMNIGRVGVGVLVLNNGMLSLSGQQTGNDLAGAALTIGNRGGTGTATVGNGSQVNITNLGSAGASLNVGGTGTNPLGNGTLVVSGASTINVTAASGLATFSVGRDGSGTASFTQGSSINIGDGAVHIGRLAGGSGALTIATGSSLVAGSVAIGGSGDTVVGGGGGGGVGSASVSGAGSTLVAGGSSGFISVGRGGTGSLSVTDRGTVSGIILNVGRSTGGVGTLTVDNAVIDLSGQQAGGNGAALSIGNRGGTGTASIANGSVVTITNMGTSGASLNVGGTPTNPLGNGTLNVANSQINVVAATGQATVRIGHDGAGTATLNASSLRVGSAESADGFLLIAGQAGSTGTMLLNGLSMVNAGYVGVGATQSAVVGVQNAAGAGRLILNNSTINTTTFELGAQGVLSGDGGVINATGDVIIGGTIDPGNSPGRIVINCNLISLAGSKLIIEIAWNGTGYDTDQLAIGKDSTFDLRNLQIEFDFVGDTDPVLFAQAGGFDLDNFLRVNNDGDFSQGLSTRFAALFGAGTTWDDVINPDLITAISSNFDITELRLQDDGSFAVAANAVPEPPTWALMLFAALVAGACARLRRRQVSMPGRGAGMSFGAAIAA